MWAVDCPGTMGIIAPKEEAEAEVEAGRLAAFITPL
jgi:hypothetical protein